MADHRLHRHRHALSAADVRDGRHARPAPVEQRRRRRGPRAARDGGPQPQRSGPAPDDALRCECASLCGRYGPSVCCEKPFRSRSHLCPSTLALAHVGTMQAFSSKITRPPSVELSSSSHSCTGMCIAHGPESCAAPLLISNESACRGHCVWGCNQRRTTADPRVSR